MRRIEQHRGDDGGKGELHVVMVDRTGLKAVRGQDQDAAQDQNGMHGRAAAEPEAGQPHAIEEGEHHQKRPDRQCHRFGFGSGQEKAEECDEIGNRQIDEPRPVHQCAVQAKTVLHRIEPALPGQKVPHHDKAHHVVIVGADIILCGWQGHGHQCRDCQNAIDGQHVDGHAFLGG